MAKGGGFEREMSKAFSSWWTKGERDDVFWRSSNSGGRATVRNRRRKTTFGQYGDMQATDPIGQPLIDLCTIEMKRGYRKSVPGDFLDKTEQNAQTGFEKFVIQARGDCEKAGSFSWLVISRRDRRQAMVAMPRPLWVALKDAGARLYQSRPLGQFTVKIEGISEKIWILPLSDFFRLASVDHVLEAHAKVRAENDGKATP
jgi:hypothetical protein